MRSRGNLIRRIPTTSVERRVRHEVDGICRGSLQIEQSISDRSVISFQAILYLARRVHFQRSGPIETVMPFPHTRPNAAEQRMIPLWKAGKKNVEAEVEVYYFYLNIQIYPVHRFRIVVQKFFQVPWNGPLQFGSSLVQSSQTGLRTKNNEFNFRFNFQFLKNKIKLPEAWRYCDTLYRRPSFLALSASWTFWSSLGSKMWRRIYQRSPRRRLKIVVVPLIFFQRYIRKVHRKDSVTIKYRLEAGPLGPEVWDWFFSKFSWSPLSARHSRHRYSPRFWSLTRFSPRRTGSRWTEPYRRCSTACSSRLVSEKKGGIDEERRIDSNDRV